MLFALSEPAFEGTGLIKTPDKIKSVLMTWRELHSVWWEIGKRADGNAPHVTLASFEETNLCVWILFEMFHKSRL